MIASLAFVMAMTFGAFHVYSESTASLEGIKGINVIVDNLYIVQLEEADLDLIKKDIVKRLNQAGITTGPDYSPYLRIYIGYFEIPTRRDIDIGYACVLNISFFQKSVLSASSHEMMVSTWDRTYHAHDHFTGTSTQIKEFIIKYVPGYINDFIEDFRDANPDLKDKVEWQR